MKKQGVALTNDHGKLLARIDQVLEAKGWTSRGWSIAATGKPDTIRNIQRGGSKAPRTDTLAKLAAEAQVTFDWLMGGAGPEMAFTPDEGAQATGVDAKGRLPLIGFIGAGDKLYHFGIGETRLSEEAPPGVRRGLVAEVRGQSMLPVYRNGDMVVGAEHPGKIEELVGRDCFVQVVDGPLYLKILRRGAKGRFNLESYNDSAIIANQAVEWAAPVVWVKRA